MRDSEVWNDFYYRKKYLTVWWIILFVNLTGLRDIQIAGKMLFVAVPVRVFQEEINI